LIKGKKLEITTTGAFLYDFAPLEKNADLGPKGSRIYARDKMIKKKILRHAQWPDYGGFKE
jgi:hypothetical protein